MRYNFWISAGRVNEQLFVFLFACSLLTKKEKKNKMKGENAQIRSGEEQSRLRTRPRSFKQMWGVLRSKKKNRQKVRWEAILTEIHNSRGLGLGAETVNTVWIYEGLWHKSTIGSLKPAWQRPVPLPHLKGDVKGLWPPLFMCIDPSGGGGGFLLKALHHQMLYLGFTCRKQGNSITFVNLIWFCGNGKHRMERYCKSASRLACNAFVN